MPMGVGYSASAKKEYMNKKKKMPKKKGGMNKAKKKM